MSSDRNNPRTSLECEVKVLTALHISPSNANFGQIKRSDPAKTKTFKLSRGDGGPIAPEIVSTGNPQISATVREVVEGEEYALDVTVGPPWPNGMLRGNVMLETGVGKAKRESITVYANIAPRLRANPHRFMLQPEPENPLDLSARLTWTDGDPGKILEASVTDTKLTVDLEERDDQQIVVLHIPAGYNPTRRSGNAVVLKTNDPAVPTMKIPVYVTRRAARPGTGRLPIKTPQPIKAGTVQQKNPLTATTQPAKGTNAPSRMPVRSSGNKEKPAGQQ